MRFTPQSEEELQAEAEKAKEKFAPWPSGTICDYEILSAKDTKKDGSPAIDKNGNEFLIADIRIFNSAGEQRDLTHNLGDWNKWHLKRICDANGMEDRYLSGQVDTYDLRGKTGKCIIKIEKGGPKGDGTFYNDKNVIDEFLKIVGTKPKSEEKDIGDFLNDEVGF